jgi:monofunctional biosynthetic peptidoglycan transglycosylase
VPYAQISDHLKRAVIASEDDDFINHDGVEWERHRESLAEATRKAEAQLAAKRAAKTPHPRQTCPVRKAPKIRRRLHHHPATRQEPAAVGASAPCCARARNSC